MLGQFVRQYRKSIGKTLADVSADSGLTINQIHEIEKHGRGNLATLNRISQAIGLEWVGGIARGPTLGERIKRERCKKGLAVKELADRAGVSVAAVTRSETDRGHISTAEKLLRILAPNIRARILRHKQPTRIRDVLLTMPEVCQQVRAVLGGIDTDPAGHPADFVQAKVRYCEADNGLAHDWFGKVFVNPPFSMAAPFIRKAAEQVAVGNAEVVLCLLPARVGDSPFQKLADQSHVILLPGRMTFCDENQKPLKYEAPFPMMIMVFGGDDALIERAKMTWGGVHIPRVASFQHSKENSRDFV